MNKFMILLLTCVLGASAYSAAFISGQEAERLQNTAARLYGVADKLSCVTGVDELQVLSNNSKSAVRTLSSVIDDDIGSRFVAAVVQASDLERQIRDAFGARLEALQEEISQIAKAMDDESEIARNQVALRVHHSR
jgi:hypothetical protein